jgi:hypothetical protein
VAGERVTNLLTLVDTHKMVRLVGTRYHWAIDDESILRRKLPAMMLSACQKFDKDTVRHPRDERDASEMYRRTLLREAGLAHRRWLPSQFPTFFLCQRRLVHSTIYSLLSLVRIMHGKTD